MFKTNPCSTFRSVHEESFVGSSNVNTQSLIRKLAGKNSESQDSYYEEVV